MRPSNSLTFVREDADPEDKSGITFLRLALDSISSECTDDGRLARSWIGKFDFGEERWDNDIDVLSTHGV